MGNPIFSIFIQGVNLFNNIVSNPSKNLSSFINQTYQSITTHSNSMILDCEVQSYAWGKLGNESEVARLKKAGDSAFVLDANKSYAELWMGTHPSCPSKLRQGNQQVGPLLSDYLREKPQEVGMVPEGYTNNDLPFLFKVLSIKTALSIQAHPDKALAKELFVKFPSVYKDPNHKPEMAVALTPFEALCGFRNVDEIKSNLNIHHEINELLSEEVRKKLFDLSDDSNTDLKKDAIRCLFHDIMHKDETAVKSLIEKIVSRLHREQEIQDESINHNDNNKKQKQANGSECNCHNDPKRISQLMLRLNIDFPGDIGVLMPTLLNTLELMPGDCFFMGPNEPHAYISGDCVEIMALSDNVVRSGLTPKFKDVATLCSMLHYRCGTPSWVAPVTLEIATLPQVMWTQLYRPSREICAEFELEYVQFNTARLPCTNTLQSTATATAAHQSLPVSVSVPVSVESETITHFRSLPSASILLFYKVNTHTDVSIQLTSDSASDSASAESESKINSSFASVRVHEGLIMFLPAATSAHLLRNSSNSNGKNNSNSADSVLPSSEYDIAVYRAHINLG